MTWWEWLSGKKMLIGSVMLWLATVAIPFLVAQGFDPSWLGFVTSALIWIGGILVPGGAVHKVVKAKKH